MTSEERPRLRLTDRELDELDELMEGGVCGVRIPRGSAEERAIADAIREADERDERRRQRKGAPSKAA